AEPAGWHRHIRPPSAARQVQCWVLGPGSEVELGGTSLLLAIVKPAACRNGRATSTAWARFRAIQKQIPARGSSIRAAETTACATSEAPREVSTSNQASQQSSVPVTVAVTSA